MGIYNCRSRIKLNRKDDNMFLLIFKLIIDIILFNKKEGINVFLLNDHEMEYYNLDHKENNDHMAHDQNFPIYIGKDQI